MANIKYTYFLNLNLIMNITKIVKFISVDKYEVETFFSSHIN